MADDTAKETHSDGQREVVFHYIKSSSFRVMHVDGAWGGVTPRLDIQIALYSERSPIPQQVVHNIAPGGALGNEIRSKRVSREGIVREVEAEVVLDVDVAKGLRDWLTEKITECEQAIGQTKHLG